MTSTWRTTAGRSGAGLLLPGLGLLLWYAVSRQDDSVSALLVPPRQVAETLWLMLTSGELWQAVQITCARVAAGFALGSALGIALGVLLARWRRLESTLGLLINALAQVPSVAWAPLLISALGIDEAFKLVLIALACFFPVAVNVRQALQNFPPALLEAAASLTLTPWLRYRKVLLPGIRDQLLTGLRLGLSSAWIIALFSELFAASSGLGFLINSGRMYFQMDTVLAATLCTGLLAYACDRVLLQLQRTLAYAR
ncbi:ABC transporter permease [Pseudomonas sp. 5P_3.1_Bac2]|uniref:ABC transporter permease n=1 Tax=Pseudomonas sp. 5P_3.1_Bac2 TaxID=2971617 RepID=UPI0021C757F3|nr:ABC transporter permease [Pseudomonas sp. 5P_3.1_Bac2]MCU1718187.1 ABC transporter permease [Pseudomonas sp. 5P_3.1_Bac2]